MFEHAVFLPFHRLKLQKYEDFEKHYLGKSYAKSLQEINTYWHTIFQNNVFQNVCISAVSTDGMIKQRHVPT